MDTTLNIDGFIEYAHNTGKYKNDQLQAVANALCLLEQDMAQLPCIEYGWYSHEYIANHLTPCGKKLEVYMMTNGLKKAKAQAAVKDFKKWMKAYT